MRELGMLLLWGSALVASSAGGSTLYDNGPVTDPASDGRCSSAISLSCGGDGDWTFYDNFVLATDAVMTGLDYVDWFAFGSFADPADYDRVRETDYISVEGLDSLAPGKPLTVILHHVEGPDDRFEVRHSLNEEQIAWFKAGSALNVLRQASGA